MTCTLRGKRGTKRTQEGQRAHRCHSPSLRVGSAGCPGPYVPIMVSVPLIGGVWLETPYGVEAEEKPDTEGSPPLTSPECSW